MWCSSEPFSIRGGTDSEHETLDLGHVLEVRIARTEEVTVAHRLGGREVDHVRVRGSSSVGLRVVLPSELCASNGDLRRNGKDSEALEPVRFISR